MIKEMLPYVHIFYSLMLVGENGCDLPAKTSCVARASKKEGGRFRFKDVFSLLCITVTLILHPFRVLIMKFDGINSRMENARTGSCMEGDERLQLTVSATAQGHG